MSRSLRLERVLFTEELSGVRKRCRICVYKSTTRTTAPAPACAPTCDSIRQRCEEIEGLSLCISRNTPPAHLLSVRLGLSVSRHPSFITATYDAHTRTFEPSTYSTPQARLNTYAALPRPCLPIPSRSSLQSSASPHAVRPPVLYWLAPTSEAPNASALQERPILRCIGAGSRFSATPGVVSVLASSACDSENWSREREAESGLFPQNEDPTRVVPTSSHARPRLHKLIRATCALRSAICTASITAAIMCTTCPVYAFRVAVTAGTLFPMEIGGYSESVCTSLSQATCARRCRSSFRILPTERLFASTRRSIFLKSATCAVCAALWVRGNLLRNNEEKIEAFRARARTYTRELLSCCIPARAPSLEVAHFPLPRNGNGQNDYAYIRRGQLVLGGQETFSCVVRSLKLSKYASDMRTASSYFPLSTRSAPARGSRERSPAIQYLRPVVSRGVVPNNKLMDGLIDLELWRVRIFKTRCPHHSQNGAMGVSHGKALRPVLFLGECSLVGLGVLAALVPFFQSTDHFTPLPDLSSHLRPVF
ncbi:hypothetical protein B0H13DRAFT_2361882 [Mycena leptocephala]|nr:hypothetical protein B0H13DRAFT_2361882 [Mycena leptocephala]